MFIEIVSTSKHTKKITITFRKCIFHFKQIQNDLVDMMIAGFVAF